MKEVNPVQSTKDPDITNFVIGDNYMVRRLDGTIHMAELIEMRKNECENNRDELYFHYDGCDRRLDEWVTLDRITLNSQAASLRNVNSVGGKKTEAGIGESERKLTRNQKRKHDEINPTSEELDLDPASAALEREHKEITKIKYIDTITFGRPGYEIETWYFSPYPDEYGRSPKLYICEFCLKYMRFEETFASHVKTCQLRHPPGTEIYRKGNLSVFEIDGGSQKLYCQCLCLLAKLFLDHKTLYYDVEPFLFYLLCEVDNVGCHLVGYFSKEKESPDNNILACIMILPPFQRKGYGKFLIQLSYELARREGVFGCPESPLSDLGQRSYRSYWSWAILEVLKGRRGTVTMKDISDATGIAQADVTKTLQTLGMTKYWIKQHVVCVTPKLIDDCMKLDQFKPPAVQVDKKHLFWEPYFKRGERRSHRR